ncbi:hypothetical protein HW555_011795, partial [Spodoptera exigua]
GLQLFVDGEQYGNIDPGDGFFSTARQHAVPHASNWLRGTFYISLGLRVGGVHDFADDIPEKPWRNRGSKAMLDFWKNKATWHPSCMKLKSILIEILVFVALCRAQNGGENFEVPTPTVEALQPKGFRIILKDDGYSFVGFRININVDFEDGLNDGQINKDNTQPRNGYWVYMNRKEKLNVGDTIYYWLYVIKNGMGHFVTDLAYEVTHLANENQTPPALNSRNPSSLDPVDPSCTVSKTLVQGKSRICKDALIFSEDFERANLEELKQWAPSILFPGEPDYPFNVYDPNKTLRINGGSLVITPVLTESIYGKDFIYNSVLDLDERCTGVAHSSECRMEALGAQILPPVITAKITTRYSFNFTYGRVEVRAKLPYGSWLLPEINLEPLEYSYGYNYDSGLMRIAFVRGNSNVAKKLYGGPVLADADPFRSELLQEKIGTDNWYKDYHNYTLIWKPDGLDMLVDGEMYGTVDPGSGFSERAKKYNIKQTSSWNKGTIMAPLDRMFYVSLGLRVGGINDFDDNTLDGKPWKNTESKATLNFWKAKDVWYPSWSNSALKVDYVKVYAL